MAPAKYDDDDGRVIADMSTVGDRPPLLIPDPSGFRSKRTDMAPPEEQNDARGYDNGTPVDREERRAIIGGAVSAGLLVIGVLAAAFAALILLIGHVWG